MAPFKKAETKCKRNIVNSTIKKGKTTLKNGMNNIKILARGLQNIVKKCQAISRDKLYTICRNILWQNSSGMKMVEDSRSMLYKINYANLLESLKKCVETEEVPEQNFFIDSPDANSPQHIASCLSNFKFVPRNVTDKLAFFRERIISTLNSMNENETCVLIALLMFQRHLHRFFPNLKLESNLKSNLNYIVEEILQKQDCTYIAVCLIRRWLLVIPILKELSKFVGWKSLQETRTILLNVDALYKLYLDLMQWQEKKHHGPCVL